MHKNRITDENLKLFKVPIDVCSRTVQKQRHSQEKLVLFTRNDII